MYFSDNTAAARAVVKLAEDVWNIRNSLLRSPTDVLYLPYRLSIDLTNFYVHIVIQRDYWYYTLSEQSDVSVDQTSLRFREDKENPEWETRGSSYRRYLFQDVLEGEIEKKLNAISKTCDRSYRPYLWNTFPLTNFRG
jgi:hypothetical protein